VSTVDDHRKPSPSDDQPRDSVYSFEDLAGDPALRGRARYLGLAAPRPPRTALADPRGQTPPPTPPRRQSPYQPPEPPPQPTPEQLAQRLVARGLALPHILEPAEAYTTARRNPDAS